MAIARTPQGPREEDLPYLPAGIKVAGNPRGLGQSRWISTSKRGVWVAGRVIEEDTGKPVRARLEYFVFVDNPHVERYPAFSWRRCPTFITRDGAFQFVAFPGPGVLTADARGDEYILGAGVDTLKHKLKYRYLEAYPNGVVPSEHHVLAEIDPVPGTVSMNRDLPLQRPVLDRHGTGPNGQTPRRQSFRRAERHTWVTASGKNTPPPEASTYTILGLRPGKERNVRFLNAKSGLTGQLVLRGDESHP